MKKNLAMPVAALVLFIFIWSSACNNQNTDKQACRDTYSDCKKACNEKEIKVWQDDSTCRAKCNSDLKVAIDKCNYENDKVKRIKCSDDAFQAFQKCMASCDEKLKQALKDIKDCMNSCETDFQNCLSK